MRDKNSLIADTLHGSIMLSGFEKDVMVTTLFNRLHDIYQNSTAYMTFPANRTKRMEHSLGCLYLCGNIFYSSICNADEEVLKDFFGQVDNELKAILHAIGKTSEGKQYDRKLGGVFKKIESRYTTLTVEGGIFNYYTPANIKTDNNKKLYGLLFEGIRIAALLHDIGHPPYSHISENALNYLYGKISKKEERNKKENEFLDILDETVGNNHQLHEEMGIKIADMLLMDAIKDIDEEEVYEEIVYEEQLYKILVREIALHILSDKTNFFKDMHVAIDGTLDGDRLDYVSRDPGNSGFKLGTTEYDRLVYKIKLCKEQAHYLFCPNVSVVKTVEDFLMRRWNLYKNIIFHHRVIKTDYLLQNAIIKIAEKYFEDGEEEKEEDTYILPYDISGLWKANKALPSNRENSHALSQWNDAWLLTILKKVYFEKYIDERSFLHDQLEEFLTNKKNYYSLIKRKEEFQEIDFCVSRVINERREELENTLEQLRIQGDSLKGKKPIFDIEGYLKGIREVIDNAKKDVDNSFNERGGFVLCTIERNLFGIEPFSVVLDHMMEDLGFEQGELFYAEKKPKTGTSKDLFFYQEGNIEDTLKSLDEISNISNVLKEDLKFSPFFFIYINKKSRKEGTAQEIRKKIGRSIGYNVVNYMLNKMGSFISS